MCTNFEVVWELILYNWLTRSATLQIWFRLQPLSWYLNETQSFIHVKFSLDSWLREPAANRLSYSGPYTCRSNRLEGLIPSKHQRLKHRNRIKTDKILATHFVTTINYKLCMLFLPCLVAIRNTQTTKCTI